jgi:hypothetical protein
MLHPLNRLLVPALALVLCTNGLAQTTPKPAGHWEGTVAMPNQDVGMVVDLAWGEASAWIGSVSFRNSTTADVPLNNIEVDKSSVRFRLIGIDGDPVFEGKLSEDGTGLAGMASNDKGAVPFQLKRIGEPDVKVPPASSPLSKEFEGSWEASLSRGGKAVRIVLNLTRGIDGKATGTLSGSSGEPFPITTVVLKDNEIHLDLRVVSGHYDGKLVDGEITGQWTEPASTVSVVFHRGQ